MIFEHKDTAIASKGLIFEFSPDFGQFYFRFEKVFVGFSSMGNFVGRKPEQSRVWTISPIPIPSPKGKGTLLEAKNYAQAVFPLGGTEGGFNLCFRCRRRQLALPKGLPRRGNE